MSSDGEILVDARGHRCPTPTLRLLADDPLARIDVPHFLQGAGARLIESSAQGGVLSFLVEAD